MSADHIVQIQTVEVNFAYKAGQCLAPKSAKRIVVMKFRGGGGDW